MSKFTQGEWKYNKEYIFLPNGKWYQPNGFVSDEERQANARLITAAPKMYERLKLVARLISRQAQGQFNDKFDPAIADSIYELLASIDNEPVETMKYSSSFFQNRNCEYFPCHDGVDPDKFSCLFCFCPLYHMEKCPGTPRTLSNGVKDCFGCTWPHAQYEDVIRMLRYEEVIRVLREEGTDETARR